MIRSCSLPLFLCGLFLLLVPCRGLSSDQASIDSVLSLSGDNRANLKTS